MTKTSMTWDGTGGFRMTPHVQPRRRQFMSASMAVVDLDDLLEAAEREYRAAADHLAATTTELDSVRQRIARYDAQQQAQEVAGGGDDDDAA